MPEEMGYLAIILHAHLPFVRHVEEDFLEERWFFEALTETYIPLVQTFESLVEDQVDFRISFSLSPTLLSMLDDELMLKRYKKHLEKQIELAQKEVARTRRDAKMNRLAVHYLKTFIGIREWMENYSYQLIPRFSFLHQKGVLELMTTSATHGFMPAMETEEAIYAQWDTGLSVFEKHFHFRPKGVWLPECGFTPGLDRILKKLGISYFICDSHTLEHATPKPPNGTVEPVRTPHGLFAFARDQESSSQVWSSFTGYPGEFDYREYYRDIGYDLPMSYIKPYIHPKGIRVSTGIKYYRITGKTDEKQLYEPKWAEEKAALHAGNFMFNREQQAMFHNSRMEAKPLIIAPYDAELFGHWWYEGPLFINFLCKKIYYDQKTIRLITPSEYLELYPDHLQTQLPLSTWGRSGYAEVWVGPNNAWMYRHLHKAERRMIELANQIITPSELEKRALDLAARQLLLAQSSDWAFMIDNQSMEEYAVRRVNEHIGIFTKLYKDLLQQQLDPDWISSMEYKWPLFEDLSYVSYASNHFVEQWVAATSEGVENKRRILMLSWEYPPKIIGGLARAVYDLSCELAKQGEEVHVFTSEVEYMPAYEVMDGVHVHRLAGLSTPKNDSNFMDWVLSLNLAMVRHYKHCLDEGLTFDLVHAHDWLVGIAAKEIKNLYRVPLIATIHATEHGRNQGIYTDLQRKIHHLEWQLTYEAQKIITCSEYMANEVIHLHQLPVNKVSVIANGVNPKQLMITEFSGLDREKYALPNERILFFVGRLVREKGVQLLIEAAPTILKEFPDVKFIIAGKGPMYKDLEQLAFERGVANKFLFTGFIDDMERNFLFCQSYLAVFPSLYEPFGIVALEAMAASVPVLVSDTGGLAEIIQHGDNGLKVYPGMVTSLQDQIVYALRNPEHLENIANKAKLIIDHQYNWSQIGRLTREAYDSIVTRKSLSLTSG